MGSKNKILLGLLSNIILHHFKNIITQRELYITKFKVKKIKNKHPEIVPYILENKFQEIIDNTIATCEYSEIGIYNFLANIDNRYILYSVSINNFYVEGGTLFYTSKRQLKKCKSSVKFFNKKFESDFEEYLK